jgi:hypothetical protein
MLFHLWVVPVVDELAREHLELFEISFGTKAEHLLDQVSFGRHSPPTLFVGRASKPLLSWDNQ